MIRTQLTLTAVILAMECSPGLAGEASPTDAQVTAAVEQALPFIQREGLDWIEQPGCVSCHQVPFMMWSLHTAADHGLAVNAEKLRSLSEWATDWQHFTAEEDVEDDEEQAAERMAKNVDTMYQLLLGRRDGDEIDAQPRIGQFLTSLAQTQQEDGSWPVPSTKQAKRQQVTETATYWGTCWAVIGLLETLEL